MTDVRKEAMKYLYQPSIFQQYAMNASGGGERFVYYVSGGYDRNRENVIDNENNRLNINMENTFTPYQNIVITSGLWYSKIDSRNNGLTIEDLKANGTLVGLSPYLKLWSQDQGPLPIIKDYRSGYVNKALENGLLDWEYRPLEERSLIDRQSKQDELRVNASLRYSFLNNFNMHASYQYVKSRTNSTILYNKDSYYVRDLVNKYTQSDGTTVILLVGYIRLFLLPHQLDTQEGCKSIMNKFLIMIMQSTD
ncbi:hypothetical protein KUH03_30920 [Sphingobacterium sp. E70]|uniref:hypothetical protein n=1 Tax=Sphingobacterium sp. E70 TaxID=2853439 RepID=UPI00211CC872|nr:hypothetical protein [Sphingobacterium sp. E70]ULT23549.1 hypothetical protein KUH03_30920 [Sphingobacterium sp. E70]